MRYTEEFVCPYCDTLIGENDVVYMRDDAIIGCEYCIDDVYIHILTKEELEEELEEEYAEMLAEDARIARAFDL